jgi:hypothetical protein
MNEEAAAAYLPVLTEEAAVAYLQALMLCVSRDSRGRATLVPSGTHNHSDSLTVVRAFDLRPLIARLAVVGIGGLCVLRRGVVLSDLRRAGAG